MQISEDEYTEVLDHVCEERTRLYGLQVPSRPHAAQIEYDLPADSDSWPLHVLVTDAIFVYSPPATSKPSDAKILEGHRNCTRYGSVGRTVHPHGANLKETTLWCAFSCRKSRLYAPSFWKTLASSARLESFLCRCVCSHPPCWTKVEVSYLEG